MKPKFLGYSSRTSSGYLLKCFRFIPEPLRVISRTALGFIPISHKTFPELLRTFSEVGLLVNQVKYLCYAYSLSQSLLTLSIDTSANIRRKQLAEIQGINYKKYAIISHFEKCLLLILTSLSCEQ